MRFLKDGSNLLLLVALHVSAAAILAGEAPILFEEADRSGVYAIAPDGTDLALLVPKGRQPAVSPDGKTALVVGEDDLLAVSLDDRSTVPLGLGPDARDPSWSPDGKRIAFARYGMACVANRDGTGLKVVADGGILWPRWSPTQSNILYYNYDRPESLDAYEIRQVDVVTGESRLVLASRYFPEIPYPLSADGTRFLVSGCPGGGFCLRVLTLATGTLQEIGPSGGSGPREAAWSPDARYIAYDVTHGTEGLYLASADGQSARMLVPGAPDAAPGAPAWSPSGDALAFHMRNPQGGPHQLYVIDIDGTGLRRLAEGGWPCWTPMPSTYSAAPSTDDTSIEPRAWGQVKRERR